MAPFLLPVSARARPRLSRWLASWSGVPRDTARSQAGITCAAKLSRLPCQHKLLLRPLSEDAVTQASPSARIVEASVVFPSLCMVRASVTSCDIPAGSAGWPGQIGWYGSSGRNCCHSSAYRLRLTTPQPSADQELTGRSTSWTVPSSLEDASHFPSELMARPVTSCEWPAIGKPTCCSVAVSQRLIVPSRLLEASS